MKTDRVPNDLLAERALIGAMLINPRQVIPDVKLHLNPNAFFLSEHQTLAQALFEVGTASDLITIRDYLASRFDEFQLDELMSLLAKVADETSTWASYQQHINIIKRHYTRRRLLHTTNQIRNRLQNFSEDVSDITAELRQALLDIENTRDHRPTPKEITDETWADLERRISSGSHALGVATGFPVIDEATGGLEPRCSYYVIAGIHVGKSAFALQIADNIAQMEPQKQVLYITLESQATILTRRRMSRLSGIPLTRIRKANIYDEYDWERLTEAASVCCQENLWIIDDVELSNMAKLSAFVESQAFKVPLSLVVVDHLQLTYLPGRWGSNHEMYKEISRRLNYLAKTVNAPLLVVSQVNKEGEAKESRDIRANADNEWRLERDSESSPLVKVICTKGKDSGLWRTTMRFDSHRMTFVEQ